SGDYSDYEKRSASPRFEEITDVCLACGTCICPCRSQGPCRKPQAWPVASCLAEHETHYCSLGSLKLSSGASSASSTARSLFATLEQPRRFHPIRPGRECRRRTAPAQRLNLLKERRIGAQRREFLEEQRELAPSAENVRRKGFDPPVANQKLGSSPWS